MSPITVRADVVAADVCDDICKDEVLALKKESKTERPVAYPHELKMAHAGNRTRSGAVKLDAAFQALNEQPAGTRGVNHKPPHADDEPVSHKTRRNARNASGRSSEESVRSRKSGEGRRSVEGSRRSTESQRSATETAQDNSTDQLTQITDVLLSRLITTLSDSTLGNPALLLQTLLGFSPDDYNDLLAALSESRLSYVDIISAYLHNIRVMSEDSGSTSAALSGTLTRSLVEQYNSLLAQAVKSPQSIARASMVNDDARSAVADLLQRAANQAESKPERRSFESVPRGPSGLGFGRRHSADSAKQSRHFAPVDNKLTSQPMTDTGLLELTKMLTSAQKIPVPDMNGNGSVGVPQQGNSVGGLTQEQLAAFLQSASMLPNAGAPYIQQPAITPSLPLLHQPVGNNMNGMLAMNLTNPYVMPQMQPWTLPMQQQASRGGLAWQAAATVGMTQPPTVFKGWGGAGLETVPENFNAQLQMTQPNLPCFSQALCIQPQF